LVLNISIIIITGNGSLFVARITARQQKAQWNSRSKHDKQLTEWNSSITASEQEQNWSEISF